MKNIYLYAFIDTNFGDNMFVHNIARRYPTHRFHMVVNEAQRDSYELLAGYENNVVLVEKANEAFLKQMDGMFIVGGDMFGENKYEALRYEIKTIRNGGGKVFFLGNSLFAKYSLKTKYYLRKMFSMASHIVVRENQSYEQMKKYAGKVPVVLATDMAFTVDVTEAKKVPEQKGLLGISVRKKIPRNTQDTYKEYCQNHAKVIAEYLKQDESHKVRLLALSRGIFDDEAVSKDIIELCDAEYRDRIEIASFDGDVDGYIIKMQECESLLCTRFHALVFAILLDKPFVPVIYEDKMTRLLDEIGYEGLRLYYEKDFDIEETLASCNKKVDLGQSLRTYFTKADKYFEAVDEFMK